MGEEVGPLGSRKTRDYHSGNNGSCSQETRLGTLKEHGSCSQKTGLNPDLKCVTQASYLVALGLCFFV